MDAIFGLFFLLYLAVSVIAAVSRAFRTKPRGSGAPRPGVPPVQMAVPPDNAPQAPAATEWSSGGGQPAESESMEEAMPATEVSEGAPSDEDKWQSTEGESLEWADLESREEDTAAAARMVAAREVLGGLTRAALIQAVIMNEVLGPPRAFRPGRTRR